MNLKFGIWQVKKSESKPAFNIIGTVPGCKYKIARCPYFVHEGDVNELNEREMKEAEAHANLIAIAPDLLLSLKILLRWSAHLPQLANDDVQTAFDTIKKAEAVNG